jgi:hypothetical protein
MKDYIFIFALAFVLWAWSNLFLRRKKRQHIIQKEMKILTLKRLKNKIKSDKKQIQKTVILKKAGRYSRTFGNSEKNAYFYVNEKSGRIKDGTVKPEGKRQRIGSPSIHKNMNTDFLRRKVKRAEFKRTAIKNLKVFVFGLVFLWSCLTFYDLYRDFSWKENIVQIRWFMLNIKINLAGGIYI